MTTLARIVKPSLADFGKELLANGYKVYVFRSDVKRVENGGRESVAETIGFSREVNGKTCYASVSLGYFGAANFNMPITPSTKNGSGMWIGGSRELRDRETYGSASEALVLENAALYASPTGHNPLVGTQANDGGAYYGENGIYVEVTA
jgi:hypothetical protein